MQSRPAHAEAGSPHKPMLRGVSHELGFLVAVPLAVVLDITAPAGRARVGAIVFSASVALMFGASALYHRPTWSPSRRRWLRRLDHAGVYGLIAGTYTPIGLVVLHGAWRIVMLVVVWAGALLAIGLRLAWVGAPKWLSVVLGVMLGWVGVIIFPQLLHTIGVWPSLLLLAGGLCYTVGALVYAWRKPDPFPTVFGYHELFHALVVAAAALQYVVIAFFVLPRA